MYIHTRRSVKRKYPIIPQIFLCRPLSLRVARPMKIIYIIPISGEKCNFTGFFFFLFMVFCCLFFDENTWREGVMATDSVIIFILFSNIGLHYFGFIIYTFRNTAIFLLGSLPTIRVVHRSHARLLYSLFTSGKTSANPPPAR